MRSEDFSLCCLLKHQYENKYNDVKITCSQSTVFAKVNATAPAHSHTKILVSLLKHQEVSIVATRKITASKISFDCHIGICSKTDMKN